MAQARQRVDAITHLDISRWTAVALTLAALAMCAVESGGALHIVSTAAYVTVTGFAVLDGAGALPASLNMRPYMWISIVPLSIAINVIAGTALTVAGPGLSSCWMWAIAAAIVAAGMTVSARRRRTP